MEYYTPSYDDMKEWNDYDPYDEKVKKESYDYYETNKDRLDEKSRRCWHRKAGKKYETIGLKLKS